MTAERHEEDRVHRAVVDAVTALDGPNRARLARIERDMLERAGCRRSGRLQWGLLLAGLAAAGAAAFWAASHDWPSSPGERGDEAPAAAEPVTQADDQPVPASGDPASDAAAAASREEPPAGEQHDAAGDDARDGPGDGNAPIIYIAP